MSATEAVVKLSGRCHCGHVQFNARGPVIKCSACDCRGCQRATGTLSAPFVTVPRAGFAVTAGQATEFRAKGDAQCDQHGVWGFCAACGAPLYWKGHHGDELDLLAGALDDPSVYTKSG